MPSTESYVEQAAADFKRHVAGGGGWALGLEVAACVKPGTDNGRPPRNRRDHDGSKISAREFAVKAGTSTDRVIRYYDAWLRAAADGVVAPPHEIDPADWNHVDHLPEGYQWGDYYDAAAGAGRNVEGDRRERLDRVATRRNIGRGTVFTVASNPKAVAAALDADPQFAAAVEAEQIRAHARDRAEGLPDAPFDEPPMIGDGATAWMDADALIARLHTRAVLIERHIRQHPAAWEERAERLEREADLINGLASLSRGISDDDLSALLES